MSPKQLSFDLASKPALGRDDFFVSPSNAQAVAMIESWEAWPSRKLALIGPAGAGKTHLVHVWAALTGATIVPAVDLVPQDIPRLARHHVAVEDVAKIAGDVAAQEALFHLHNLALAEGRSLLFTAQEPPIRWGLTLPDLQSRMQGTTVVVLDGPDDDLLAAVLMKLFTDRQISPAPDTIPYLARHMDRSFAAAREVVANLDEAALSHGREINRNLAKTVLAELPERSEG